MDKGITESLSSVESLGVPDGHEYKIGSWYWRNNQDDLERNPEKASPWCVVEVGSNYVKIKCPSFDRSSWSSRIHFDQVVELLTHCSDADAKIYFDGQIEDCQKAIVRDTLRIQQLTKRLTGQAVGIEQQSSDKGLVVLNEQPDMDEYKKQLSLARNTTIPELTGAIKKSGQQLKDWMLASSLPMLCKVGDMTDAIELIDDRVFNISLYVGISEEATHCSSGDPAPATEKLRVMQRRLYMDEESLLDYAGEGMSYSNIGEFDEWISKPFNRDRILPFPKCIVSMRVRRDKKSSLRGSGQSMVGFHRDMADMGTYLYIRNGENVYRLQTELDFGEMLFPDQAVYDPSSQLMVQNLSREFRFEKVSTYEVLKKDEEERKAAYDKWEIENPDNFPCGPSNPHRSYRTTFSNGEWDLLTPDYLYYDDAMRVIADEVKQYNRISTIIQGLFDRTEIMHPCNKMRMWVAEEFEQNIQLVYDASNVLDCGDAPDFEEYRKHCNATMNKNSMLVGQWRLWQKHEAQKQYDKLQRTDRYGHWDFDPSDKFFTPEGNNGPRMVMGMSRYNAKGKKASFKWKREKLTGERWGEMIDAGVTVDATQCLNVDAYQLGDFRKFFSDPRTRQNYLKWAPLLMAAEEYKKKIAGGDKNGC
jgi:hypothetical protein